jgi:hypothetical protein
MAWPLMFWMVITLVGDGFEPDAHRDGDRHRRQHVRGVVFLVQHLVADQRPAGGLDHADVEALLLVEAQRVGHDQRAGAGDRDEADLEVLLLQAALFLGHGFQRAEGDQRGDRRPARRRRSAGGSWG